MKRKIKFHLMNPFQKWSYAPKRRFPWKLLLQVVNMILVVVQVWVCCLMWCACTHHVLVSLTSFHIHTCISSVHVCVYCTPHSLDDPVASLQLIIFASSKYVLMDFVTLNKQTFVQLFILKPSVDYSVFEPDSSPSVSTIFTFDELFQQLNYTAQRVSRSYAVVLLCVLVQVHCTCTNSCTCIIMCCNIGYIFMYMYLYVVSACIYIFSCTCIL